jgi:paraquat-inducible protein B
MSVSTHLKLGLFALAAVAAVVAIAVALGIRGVRTDTVHYHSYFDESVQGLEVGSPVKYRGVKIGNVTAIEIAVDRRHVDVTLALDTRDARRLGLGASDDEPAVPSGFEAQLAVQGITGVKFVDLDVPRANVPPPPALPFATARRTIPARSSLIKSLEDNLTAIGGRLPELVDHTDATMAKLARVLDDLGAERVPSRVATALDDLDATVLDLQRLVRGVSRAQLPARAGRAIDELHDTVSGTKELVAKVGEQASVLASARRAFDAFGDLGVSAGGSAEQLDRTLRTLDEAAASLRDFLDALDRDPDMLVKGRAKAVRP